MTYSCPTVSSAVDHVQIFQALKPVFGFTIYMARLGPRSWNNLLDWLGILSIMNTRKGWKIAGSRITSAQTTEDRREKDKTHECRYQTTQKSHEVSNNYGQSEIQERETITPPPTPSLSWETHEAPSFKA